MEEKRSRDASTHPLITPTIIVNDKYRLRVESAGGPQQLIELVKWLVAKESR